MIKNLIYFFKIFFAYLLFTSISFADLQENLINKLSSTKTLSFDFMQKIADKEEFGICYIKYPLLMKCKYNNLKEKVIISNGKKLSIIKKKYKKIYNYPIKSTPLFFILQKQNIISLVKKNKPNSVGSNLIEITHIDKRKNEIKIFFEKNTLELKGWTTKDAYSNNVNFIINNLKVNIEIEDSFFKIPREEDL